MPDEGRVESLEACRWCGAEPGQPHDGAAHDAYAQSDPPGVGYYGQSGRTHSCDERCAHTVDVGYVHTLTEVGGPCRADCPHPDHKTAPARVQP